MKTVQDLVDDITSRIDTNNRKSVDVDTDILPAISRAYGRVIDAVALRSEEFLTQYAVFDTFLRDSDNNRYIIIPEDCLNLRVLGVEYKDNISDDWRGTELINQQEAYKYKEYSYTDLRNYVQWYKMGRKLVIITDSTTLTHVKIHYVQRPEQLVLPQGRITSFDEVNGQLVVDVAGPNLSYEVATHGNFINVINGSTGEVKATHQILALTGTTEVYIRETPTRTTYQRHTVLGTVQATTNIDDYICLAKGTCVIPFDEPVFSAIVEMAVNEIDAKLGEGDREVAKRTMRDFERRVEDLQVNTPKRKRVQAKAPWTYREFL